MYQYRQGRPCALRQGLVAGESGLAIALTLGVASASDQTAPTQHSEAINNLSFANDGLHHIKWRSANVAKNNSERDKQPCFTKGMMSVMAMCAHVFRSGKTPANVRR